MIRVLTEKEKSENAFYVKCRDWLVPLGYTEVFSNHPCSEEREWHWMRQGIRVVCVFYRFDPYCYLHADVLSMKYAFGIKGCKYKIGTDELDVLHSFVLNLVLSFRKKKTFIERLQNWLKNNL